MAKPSKSAAEKKQQSAEMTSESIAEQVQAFLAAGNKIEQVPRGVSGMNGPPSRHITISRKK